MANLSGYLIKHDRTNKTRHIIPFADIYTNNSIFQQLKKDIEDPSVVFSCSCRNETVSLTLSENAQILLRANEHSSECYSQYCQMLYEIEETQKGALLKGQTIDLHLSLKRDEAPTLSILDNECVFHTPIFGNIDLETYVALTNVVAFNRIASDPINQPSDRNGFSRKMESSLFFQLGTCKLRDLQGSFFSINPSTFLNEHVETGKTYFYYGLILQREIIRHYMHLTCRFKNEEVIITIPLSLWEQYNFFTDNIDNEHQLLWFAGFVRIIERTRRSQSSYDPYTHTSYPGKKQRIQEFTLKHGVLFHTNWYGLICFSESEAKEGNHAMSKGLGLTKPIFPFSRHKSGHLGYHSSMIARSNSHVYWEDFLEQIT